MIFPDLNSKEREREYRSCSESIRDKIVYEFLFNGKSHRWLDENVARKDPNYSRGWLSMGVLHYLGLIDCHKGIFDDISVIDAIKILNDNDEEKNKQIVLALLRYSQNIYSDESIELFRPDDSAPKLIKTIGTSRYTDEVRINKAFHNIFNPPNTIYYVNKCTARPIKVLFNNKIFAAEYRHENQIDNEIELQSIRFGAELKKEFKKVFPEPIGEFVIQQGIDLNHFMFSYTNKTIIDEDEGEECPEGKSAYKLHRIRERNHQVINKAKARFKKQNNERLFCEACKFDFYTFYGEKGADFIEGHHNKLVSEMKEGEKTKIEDISMLCSNCHRIIHRKPIITIKELSDIIEEQRRKQEQ